MSTLIDPGVLPDILAPSPWRQWSEEHLAAAVDDSEVAIDQIFYAEIAVGFATRGALERALQGAAIKRLALPWPARGSSPQASRSYWRAGGPHAPAA